MVMADMVGNLVGSMGALAIGAVTATAAYYYISNEDESKAYYDMSLQTIPVKVGLNIDYDYLEKANSSQLYNSVIPPALGKHYT